MKDHKTVGAYIEKNSKWEKELNTLRKILLSTGLQETIKWGAPVYTLSGKNIVGIGAFKNHFGVWFFQGALLADKHNKLMNAQEGITRAMRQWRLVSEDEIEEKLIIQYVKEAIKNQKEGKEIKPTKPVKKGKVDIPVLLQNVFRKDKNVARAFEKLSPGKQKEYAEYITGAKRETTKLKRLEKIVPMILDGIGLNDQYR